MQSIIQNNKSINDFVCILAEEETAGISIYILFIIQMEIEWGFGVLGKL